MSSPSRVSAAIVLDSRNHGESDKIITFFTRDQGRLTGIAKGANRSKKRFLNKLELFTSLTISYNEGRRSSLAFIAEADLHSGFISLRNDINRYNCASILRETILMATAEGESDPEIYQLLLWALTSLDEKRPSLGVVSIFLLRLFHLIGYCPNLTGCHFCDKAISTRNTYVFDHLIGGLICRSCATRETDGFTSLSLGTIKMLQTILSQPLVKLHRLHFSQVTLYQSLIMLHRYARHLFQREIHSWKSIDTMVRQKASRKTD